MHELNSLCLGCTAGLYYCSYSYHGIPIVVCSSLSSENERLNGILLCTLHLCDWKK